MPGAFLNVEIRMGNVIERYQKAPGAVTVALNNSLRRMGRKLVPELKSRTPVGATRNLRNKTVFEVYGTGLRQTLDVRQSARRGEFFYGEVVRVGRRPGKRPPSKALETWVIRKLGVSVAQAPGVAFLVARKIGRHGTKPNRYAQDTLRANMGFIHQTVRDFGREIRLLLAR